MKKWTLLIAVLWIVRWQIDKPVEQCSDVWNPYTQEHVDVCEEKIVRKRDAFESGKEAADFIRNAPKGVSNFSIEKRREYEPPDAGVGFR